VPASTVPASTAAALPDLTPNATPGPGRPQGRRGQLWRVLGPPARLFDVVRTWWERPGTQRASGAVLVLAFVGTLGAVELVRRGVLPVGRGGRPSHFRAVEVAFTLLLALELVALVLALARSVSESVGKQLDLLALILLRKAFVEVAHMGEPVAWVEAAPRVPGALADMAGALLVFVLAELFGRVQRHRAIAAGDNQAVFVAAKKLLALVLLAALLVGGAAALAELARGGEPAFFEVCFTVLIFSDVLLVLLSLAASADHRVVFRNSGFAAATVMMRLALTAPRFVNVLLATGAALYALLVSVVYERARSAAVAAVDGPAAADSVADGSAANDSAAGGSAADGPIAPGAAPGV
jgi:hypothetical protein